ncbi:DUF3120 domain-containing protein, partial [Synechocystis salina LEGE 06155]|nr:DUF3120 domain-containing protein [Synechocystis salina LEGE 06155]
PEFARFVFQAALAKIHTPWGAAWAWLLLALLLGLGGWALQRRSPGWQAFAGAVLSTIVVDALFWLGAMMA